MLFKKIKLSDKDMFNHYLQNTKQRLITYCFSHFYFWRNWDQYRWALVDNALVIKNDSPDIDAICVPISADDQAVLNATQRLINWYQKQHRPFTISEVSSDVLAFYEKHWPGRFIAEEDTQGANYVYLQSDLARLSGKKFAAKRNLIHRFKRYYPDYQLLPLTTELIPPCLKTLEIWKSRHDMNSFELYQEYSGSLDALNHLDKLDCEGKALVIGNKVAAFAIGEALNEQTYCIHIEKADIDIIGAYQAINCFYAQKLANRYYYINRAEDMGKPGLKRAKQSYHPCHMEKQYYLRLKDD